MSLSRSFKSSVEKYAHEHISSETSYRYIPRFELMHSVDFRRVSRYIVRDVVGVFP